MKKNRTRELISGYVQDVAYTPKAIRKDLADRYGVAWHPDTAIAPLGATSGMVMLPVYDDAEERFKRIDLFAIRAESVGDAVTYNIVMQHDFALQPRPGARGRCLDPQEGVKPRPGERPNGDWVGKALNLYNDLKFSVPQFVRNARGKWVRESWTVPSEDDPETLKYKTDLKIPLDPGVPRILAGFKDPPDAPKGNLSPYGVKTWADNDALLSEAKGWHTALYSPDDPDNPTGLWLCEAGLFAELPDNAELFEDFIELVTRREDGILDGISQICYRSRMHGEMCVSASKYGYRYEMDLAGWPERPKAAPPQPAPVEVMEVVHQEEAAAS